MSLFPKKVEYSHFTYQVFENRHYKYNLLYCTLGQHGIATVIIVFKRMKEDDSFPETRIALAFGFFYSGQHRTT